MLQPARRKYRKEQKGRNTGIATRGNTVAFGDFGLKSTDRGRLTARQIESARRAISRHVKRGGRIWIRIFPDKPISQKPAEFRKNWHVRRSVWQRPSCRCAPRSWRA